MTNAHPLELLPEYASGSIHAFAKSTAMYPGMIYHFHLRTDDTCRIPFASEGIKSIFGLAPGDVTEDARPLFAKVHEDDIEWLLESKKQSAKNLSVWRKEYRIIGVSGSIRWIGGSAVPERLADGSTLWRGYIEDITERKTIEAELQRNAGLRQLISETATDFINLPLSEVEGSIKSSLSKIASYLEVDRAYIFEYSYLDRTASNTFEWCSRGIKPCIQGNQNTPMHLFPDWLSVHEQGKTVYIPDVHELKDDSSLRSILEPQGIRSLIAVPLMKGDSCVGFVGFDSVRQIRTYTLDEQHLLEIFSRMLVNIQLRKADQQALQQSEQRFSDVIEAAGEFVWEVDANWNIRYVSACAEKLFNRPVNEILGENLINFIADNSNETILSLLQDATACAAPISKLSTSYAEKGDQARHMLSSCRPILSPKGTLTGHIGISMDITDQTNLCKELQKTRDQVEIFFESTHDLLGILTTEGQFVKVSRSWADFLGLKLSDLAGQSCLAYLHPDDKTATDKAFDSLSAGDIITGFVNRYRKHNGEYIHIEWWAQKIDGLIYSSGRDITQTKQAEQALERALNQERSAAEIKGRLMSMASHEFRTPLTLIRMRSEILGMNVEKLDSASIRSQLNSITEACSHLTEIVTDVLDYSTLGRAESSEPCVSIQLSSFLGNMAAGMEQVPKTESRVQLYIPNENATITTYASLFRRAVGNILENALKYSPAPKPVSLSCVETDSGVIIEIKDNGIGIPETTENQLYKPFFRADNVGRVRGTGLGLSICKEAMDRLGGTIRHRRNPTGGTIFTLILPNRSPSHKSPLSNE
jgi:PAS domain S-box-containing protein